MIASLGLKLLSSAWGRYLVAGLTLLAALTAFGRSREKRGRNEATSEIQSDAQRRTEGGRDAYHESRRAAPRTDVGALIDGMRRNDDRWGRL